jgi:glycosyltransferase involved in cell wall biosynthesis
MGPPTVSVLLPVYDHGALLGRAIESVLAQGFQGWELWIANDGSTDDSRAVAEGYCARFPWIRLLDLPHGGYSTAVNAAARVAAAPWLALLDADDWYREDHLEDNLAFLAQHPEADLLMGRAEVLGDPHVVDLEEPGRMIHLDECAIGGTFFVRRSAFLAVGGMPAIRFGMDYHLLRALQAAGYQVRKRTARTYVYDRIRGGTMSRSAEARLREGLAPGVPPGRT